MLCDFTSILVKINSYLMFANVSFKQSYLFVYFKSSNETYKGTLICVGADRIWKIKKKI